jgi:transglutaminase-like putative cysteine protease
VKYRLSHTTTYEYETPVLHGRHVVRKRPRTLSFQKVIQSSLRVEPQPVWSENDVDYFGNYVDTIEVIEPHERLVVTSQSELEIVPWVVDTKHSLFQRSWESVRDRLRSDPSCFEVREMSLDSPVVRRHVRLAEFGKRTFSPGRPLLSAVLEFNQRIYEEFTYDPQFSDVATPVSQVLEEKRGVCQDFAHVAVGVFRSLGLCARYVSGYLETIPPPGQKRLVGADASHAWASVYFPDFGWLPLDPTNNVIPSERHVVVAWGRDFSDVSPLRGVVHGGGRHSVHVAVDVEPVSAIDPPARSSLPPAAQSTPA